MTNEKIFDTIDIEREEKEMTFEKAMEELIRLMIENQDVLIRLKEGEEDD